MSTLYLIVKLDDFQNALGVLFAISTVLSLMIGLIGTIVFIDSDEKDGKKILNWLKLVLPIVLIVGCFKVVTPSTKQFLTIVGVNYVTTNEQVITTAEKAFQTVDTYLDEKLGLVVAKSKEITK